jgi:predicted ABC-type ATPase
MTTPRPHVVVLAGPNGAGKSTAAPTLLKGRLGVTEFVNADTIAQGLSAFSSDQAAFEAGRVMLARLRSLATQRRSFAFETTLASRTFAPRLTEWIDSGYVCHLIYFWLPSADFALARVRERVQLGGHDVPAETVRRRYTRGLANLFTLYMPLATTWRCYDNSGRRSRLIAHGKGKTHLVTIDDTLWQHITEDYEDGDRT